MVASSGLVTRKKYAIFAIAAIVLSAAVGIVLAECLLRLAFPQDTMSPRWDFSAQYCLLPFPSVRMIHERPGRWRFVYSTNAHSGRGKDLPISNRYETPNVVVLGDSYSFGAGVNDGDQYAAVLEDRLLGAAHVVNLGVGGWGLTQEIRRYYEFGSLYEPNVVILQFSANDPDDNLKCPVTTVHDGRFEFRDTSEGIFKIKKYLSRSVIQKSQLYNSVRDSIYQYFAARTMARTRQAIELRGDSTDVSPAERVYVGLLSAFADDLERRGVRLIFVTVNQQLLGFPAIDNAVHRLAEDRKLEFVDAESWLAGMTDYASPEGHAWGKPAHAVIGMRLAELVQSELHRPANDSSTPHPSIPPR